MKKTLITFFIPVIFLFINGTNQSNLYKKQSINPTDNIVGTWKLTMEAYDDNNNMKLDDDERKSGVKNSTPQALRDYKMQFNSNGTCKVEGRYNGTYKLTEEGDKKILTLQMDAYVGMGGKHIPATRHKYYIQSITSSELLLLAEVSGVTYTFWLFKKQ